MNYWTPDRVLDELVEAFDVLRDMPDRKIQGFKSAWPEYRLSETDIWFQVAEGTNKVGRMRARIQRRASEISAAERVLFGQDLKNGTRIQPWVKHFIPEKKEHIKRCLLVYVHGTVSANRFDRDFNVSGWCAHHGMAESTFRSRRDRAIELIASGLNKVMVPVW